MSSNTDWAIDNLHRQKPTWRHDSLDNPPPANGSSHRKKQSTPVAFDETEVAAERAYERAARHSKTNSAKSLKDQMFAATQAGDYDTLLSILNTKISVNLMSGELKDTPLMIACRYGMDDIARLCLNFGARNDPHPDFGQTALHCAVESKSFGCVRVLLDAASPSGSDSLITNLKDIDGNSPLHLACRAGDVRITKLLVKHGADLSLRDQHSRTSLHICSYFGHKSILSYLLDSGGDSYLELIDSDGRTALHYAAEEGHLHAVRLLLETAANPIATCPQANAHDAANQLTLTPYQLAYRAGHEAICELLLEYQRSVPDIRRRSESINLFGATTGVRTGGAGRSFDGYANQSQGWMAGHCRASTGQLISPPSLMSSSSDPHLHSSLQFSSAPVPLTRNVSYPLPGTLPLPNSNSSNNNSNALGLHGDSIVGALPRPHTNRPSSANLNISSASASTPITQLKDKDKARFGTNSPLSSPRDRGGGHKTSHSSSSSPSVLEPKTLFFPSASALPASASASGSEENHLSLPRPSTTPSSHMHSAFPSISKRKTAAAAGTGRGAGRETAGVARFSPAGIAAATAAEAEASPVVSVPSSTSVSSSQHSQFSVCGGVWNSYRTEEGHLYFLEASTQHSQWEDPRRHGILVYDEKTGGYVKCARLPKIWNLLQTVPDTMKTRDEPQQQQGKQQQQEEEEEQEEKEIEQTETIPILPSTTVVSSSDPSGLSATPLSLPCHSSSVLIDEDLVIPELQSTTQRRESQSPVSTDLTFGRHSSTDSSLGPSPLRVPQRVEAQEEEEKEDELLEEVLGEEGDRCEACSESGDVSHLMESFQPEEEQEQEESLLEISLASEEEEDEVSSKSKSKRSQQRKSAESGRDEESLSPCPQEIETLQLLNESNQSKSQSQRGAKLKGQGQGPGVAFRISNSLFQEVPLDPNGLEDVTEQKASRDNGNGSEESHRRKMQLSGHFTYGAEQDLEFGSDQPEEASEPLDETAMPFKGRPTTTAAAVSSLRAETGNQVAVLTKEVRLPKVPHPYRDLDHLSLLPSSYRERDTVTSTQQQQQQQEEDEEKQQQEEEEEEDKTKDVSSPIPTPSPTVLLETESALSHEDHESQSQSESDWDGDGESEIGSHSQPPNFNTTAPASATAIAAAAALCSSETDEESSLPLTQQLKRSLTAEELERQRIFASKMGGYGNGGSLYDQHQQLSDATDAAVTVRRVNDVWESQFHFCSHSDLLITAIQKLDRMGGRLTFENLSLLLSTLPPPHQLSSVLSSIRSSSLSASGPSLSAASAYRPGELLCQSVASFYSVFTTELQGFVLLIELTASLPPLLLTMRRMSDICNEVSSLSPLPSPLPSSSRLSHFFFGRFLQAVTNSHSFSGTPSTLLLLFFLLSHLLPSESH
jgi:hypothetical protein